jgi:predicted GNAT family acetyltransferase
MTSDADITVERNGERGTYFLALPDSEPARLTFVERSADHIIIDYSFVPPRHRGRGAALHLVKRAVEDARAGGYTITPACGYVAAEFRRHPDWNDVLQR